MIIANLVYTLCTITSLICAVMLFRGYMRNGAKLLLWSCLCFTGLTINNFMLCVDLLVLSQETDLSVWRTLPAALGLGILAYGLISDTTS